MTSFHPLLPPSTEEDRISWLRLMRSRRVGISTFYRLMAEHGSAQAALAALPQIAAAAGLTDYAPCPVDVVTREMRAGRKVGARLVFAGSPEYPKALRDLADAPPFLWVRGNIDVVSRKSIAIVGARNASSLGMRMARKLAHDLGEAGFCVVSGLARGVDTAAHLGSLTTGSIGVLAGGVDTIYPAENAQLAKDLVKTGALLSEQPIGVTAQTRHFPVRNRLISGLACGVVVIEAAAKSGSLITARNALDQGREVMAVPGHPLDGRAAGCNMLIRDGATLVRSAQDILEALLQGPDTTQHAPSELTNADGPTPPDTADFTGLHTRILAHLGPSPLSEDQLIRDLAMPSHHVLPALTELELSGQISRQAGGLLALNSAFV